jgi:hypothetical protein
MKQTVVEWLKDTVYSYLNKEDKEYADVLFKRANEMFKEQIIEFANEYAESGSFYCNGEFAIEQDAEQYYNETFKSE